jgi:hypothetical protein
MGGGKLKIGQGRNWWLMPAVQFLIMSLQYPFYWLTGISTKITYGGGQVWHTGDIFEGVPVVSLFTTLFV